MIWPLQEIYKGKDVFILGSGPSVKRFSLHRLKEQIVIGCNNAYLFGTDIVDVLIFGDVDWWNFHKDKPALRGFQNPIITNNEKLRNEPGITWAPRQAEGFHKYAIGWNGNTGSAAINLALLLGAARIFLIGFDMQLTDGRSNWHRNDIDDVTPGHYERYLGCMKQSLSQLYKNWPQVEITNLNPNSAMDLFPKATWEEAFEQ